MRRCSPDATLRPARLLLFALILACGAAASGCAFAASSLPDAAPRDASPVRDADVRFDIVWNLVHDRYWDLERTGVDWEAVREPFRARALAAPDEQAFYDVLEEMLALLGDDHSRFVAPAQVTEVREQYGDLPCIGVFALAQAQGRSGPITWRMDGRLGVIVVPDLAQDGVTAGVRQAVTALERQGAAALVLDLRGNPGGRLISMMTTAGVFTGGFLWRVATNWSLPLPYPAIGPQATALPLAVLVDGDVHSAAEGLAGALQASDRALVVGERTAGNVEAVLPFCLRDGSQVWLATGVLAPLIGPTWEGSGVVPDVKVAPDTALEAARDALLGAP